MRARIATKLPDMSGGAGFTPRRSAVRPRHRPLAKPAGNGGFPFAVGPAERFKWEVLQGALRYMFVPAAVEETLAGSARCSRPAATESRPSCDRRARPCLYLPWRSVFGVLGMPSQGPTASLSGEVLAVIRYQEQPSRDLRSRVPFLIFLPVFLCLLAVFGAAQPWQAELHPSLGVGQWFGRFAAWLVVFGVVLAPLLVALIAAKLKDGSKSEPSRQQGVDPGGSSAPG